MEGHEKLDAVMLGGTGEVSGRRIPITGTRRALYDPKGSLLGWALPVGDGHLLLTISGAVSEPTNRPDRLTIGVPVERQIRPNKRHEKRVAALSRLLS